MAWARRWPSLTNTPRSPSPSAGTSMATSSSPGSITVVRRPVKTPDGHRALAAPSSAAAPARRAPTAPTRCRWPGWPSPGCRRRSPGCARPVSRSPRRPAPAAAPGSTTRADATAWLWVTRPPSRKWSPPSGRCVQARDAGEVDQDLDAGPDTTIELDEEIGPAGHGTSRRPMIGEEGERLLHRRRASRAGESAGPAAAGRARLVGPVLASRCRSARRRSRRRAGPRPPPPDARPRRPRCRDAVGCPSSRPACRPRRSRPPSRPHRRAPHTRRLTPVQGTAPRHMAHGWQDVTSSVGPAESRA